MQRTAAPGSERLLHCSPERTLFVTTDAASGARVVTKVLVRGSQADAEREVAMGRLAGHLGVVQYLGAGTDGPSARPCVTTQLHEGTNLDSLAGSVGAVPASTAARLLQPVAVTLAAMHALRGAETPAGLGHGDVKPTNLLAAGSTTLLLDFEHAQPLGSGRRGAGAFTGGTLAFAPPEASLGTAPDASFDVYGLGATLRWLLEGGMGARLPQDPDLVQLVESCTAPDPHRRPPAAVVAEALGELGARLAHDPAEQALAACAIGDLAGARTTLATVASTDPRRGPLQRLLERRQRLLRLLPALLTIPEAVPTEPGALLRELRTAQRILARFPRHPGALRWRQRLRQAIGALLAGAAAHTATLRRAEDFEAARTWLDDSLRLAALALALPGGCPIPTTDDPRSVGMLQREPQRFLHQQLRELELGRIDLQAAAAAITAAEERLDLAAAEAAIDRMAALHGGASPTAARRRDQLHRLTFYLQRTARAHANIERLGQLWDANALAPLRQLVAACGATADRTTRHEPASGPVGLRSVQVTLVNLVEEFPHLASQAGAALEALSEALEHTTDQAWELLATAQQQLQSQPVPVRPLQLALGRLDTFRILEAFVDRPDRPRSNLQDGIESLRLALEQARATRDRLTHGAEQAIARGHWTTGLFDMERAVAGLNPNDEHDHVEAQRLRDRLAEARRRKQEVEAAVRRNVELATSYATLQDEPDSSFAVRLQVLGERRDCLHFLAMHLPAERGSLYSRDLREVETLIALEQAGLAETELDGTEEPVARLRLARATLERLGASSTVTDLGNELPGRLLRLIEHWRTVATMCQRDVERVHQEAAGRQRQRRRLVGGGLGAAAISVVAFLIGSNLWSTPSAAAGRQDAAAQLAAPVAADPGRALAELAAAAAALPDRAQPAARVVLGVVETTRTPALHPLAWGETFAAAMLTASTDGEPSTALRQFLSAAWRTGVPLAHARCAAAEIEPFRAAMQQLATRLTAAGVAIEVPREWANGTSGH